MKYGLKLDYSISYGALDPYFDSLQEGVAMASQCGSCGQIAFPARAQCRACGSQSIIWKPLSGVAKILFRTDGSSGSFALVQFDGADTNSTVELANPEMKTTIGKLVAPEGDAPGLLLALMNEHEGDSDAG